MFCMPSRRIICILIFTTNCFYLYAWKEVFFPVHFICEGKKLRKGSFCVVLLNANIFFLRKNIFMLCMLCAARNQMSYHRSCFFFFVLFTQTCYFIVFLQKINCYIILIGSNQNIKIPQTPTLSIRRDNFCGI